MVPNPSSTDSSRSSPRESASVINAIIGGVAGIVLSFIPLSTLLGGGISGYLEGGSLQDGLRVGALAGLVMFVPFAFILFLVLLFLGFAGAPALFGVLGLFVLVVSAVYTVGLSALGGYLGVYLKNEL